MADPRGTDPLRWVQDLALSIEVRAVSDLRPSPRNPRTHSKKQIHQIAASIRQFGFVNPVLVDGDGGVVAGHGRLEAAKLLGLVRVPTIRLDHLTDAQKRAYVIADNRLAELAGWDRNLLSLELQALTELDFDFEIEITGFEMAEIDLLIGEGLDTERGPDDAAPPPSGPAVTRAADLWLLGSHRLICDDARDPAVFERLLAGERAQMVFTDPPYNLSIAKDLASQGRVRHREFAMASGEMSAAEFTRFLETSLTNMAKVSADGAIHFVCMDWRHLRELLAAGDAVYSDLKNLCCWAKTNAGMGAFYRSQHELILVFKVGTAPHINNFGLGEKGRYRTNVWSYAGMTSLKPGRLDELAMHPTVKPMALVADAIKDCSKRNGVVLDGFGGSGTTLIAAEKTGRRGYLVELDPLYADVAIRRWQKLTGEAARHANTGLTFDQMAEDRLQNNDPARAEVGHG